MKNDKRELYTGVFVSALVLSNILSAKLLAIGPVIVPGGVLCYAVTYLMTDVIGERYGREQAEKTVLYGLVCQVICTALIALTCALPGTDGAEDAAFDEVFRSGVWFTVAGIAAYLVSQSVDVVLFHAIRDRMMAKGKRCKWLWNNISTLVSQMVDTIVYVGIGFGLVQRSPIGLLVQMAVGQMIVKAALAIADTPIFYFLTRKRRS